MRLYTFFLLHTIYIHFCITVFWLEAGCWMHFFLWILFLESVAKAGIVCRQKEIWCQPQWYRVGIARWSTLASERIPDTSGYHKLGSFQVPLFSFPFRPSHFLFSNRLLRSRMHVAQLACNSIHEKIWEARCASPLLSAQTQCLKWWAFIKLCVTWRIIQLHLKPVDKLLDPGKAPGPSISTLRAHHIRSQVQRHGQFCTQPLRGFLIFSCKFSFSGHPQKQNFWRSRRFKSYRCEEWIFNEQRHYISMSLITYSL